MNASPMESGSDPSEPTAPGSPKRWKRKTTARALVIICGLLLSVQIGMKVWQWWTIPRDAPVIGVTYDSAWHARAGISVKNYEVCLTRAGARIVELDDDGDDASAILDGIDAILLTGGGDVDPALSGVAPEEAEAVDRRRDDFEIALIHAAIQRDMPVLGICRGIQILNVAHGGTLRNLREDERLNEVHNIGMSSFDAHRVTVAADSKLASVAGSGDLHVNSFHGQAVDRVGDGLMVSATAEDGVIEALECPDNTFVLTTQWHPEIPPANMAFFERLIDEARRYRIRRDDRPVSR